MTELTVKDRVKLIARLKEARAEAIAQKNRIFTELGKAISETARNIQQNVVQPLDDAISLMEQLDQKDSE